MEKNAPKPPPPAAEKSDGLARVVVILEAQLEASHKALQHYFAKGAIDIPIKLMSATVALAGMLAKLKGETRQRVIVERVGTEGGTPKNRKTNSPPVRPP